MDSLRTARSAKAAKMKFFAFSAVFVVNLHFASAIACLNSTKAWIGVGSTP